MKIILTAVIISCAITCCLAKEQELTPSDLNTYAVFLSKSSVAPNNEGVDNFVIRNVDGKEVRDVAQFRFGPEGDQPRLIYVLITPGKHTVTLRYHRLKKRLLGKTTFDAEVTHEMTLSPGLYNIEGERGADYATIWALRADSKEIVFPKSVCLPRKTESEVPVIVPIPVR